MYYSNTINNNNKHVPFFYMIIKLQTQVPKGKLIRRSIKKDLKNVKVVKIYKIIIHSRNDSKVRGLNTNVIILHI